MSQAIRFTILFIIIFSCLNLSAEDEPVSIVIKTIPFAYETTLVPGFEYQAGKLEKQDAIENRRTDNVIHVDSLINKNKPITLIVADEGGSVIVFSGDSDLFYSLYAHNTIFYVLSKYTMGLDGKRNVIRVTTCLTPLGMFYYSEASPAAKKTVDDKMYELALHFQN